MERPGGIRAQRSKLHAWLHTWVVRASAPVPYYTLPCVPRLWRRGSSARTPRCMPGASQSPHGRRPRSALPWSPPLRRQQSEIVCMFAGECFLCALGCSSACRLSCSQHAENGLSVSSCLGCAIVVICSVFSYTACAEEIRIALPQSAVHRSSNCTTKKNAATELQAHRGFINGC